MEKIIHIKINIQMYKNLKNFISLTYQCVDHEGDQSTF